MATSTCRVHSGFCDAVKEAKSRQDGSRLKTSGLTAELCLIQVSAAQPFSHLPMFRSHLMNGYQPSLGVFCPWCCSYFTLLLDLELHPFSGSPASLGNCEDAVRELVIICYMTCQPAWRHISMQCVLIGSRAAVTVTLVFVTLMLQWFSLHGTSQQTTWQHAKIKDTEEQNREGAGEKAKHHTMENDNVCAG